MRRKDAVTTATAALEAGGLPEPRLEAEFLVAAALDVPRTRLLLAADEAVADEAARRVAEWTARRARREPLAYIAGDQPFMDLVLQVTSDVLVPRPETEILVEEAVKRLRSLGPSPRLVDVGTGSGNIVTALARACPGARCWAVDASARALAVARRNAERYVGAERVAWRLGDLLSAVEPRVRFEMIVANLPYVRSEEIDRLEPEVRREPRLALDGGPDGLGLVRRLIDQAAGRLAPGGWLMLEIGFDQAAAVESSLRPAGGWAAIEKVKDFSGRWRIVAARKGSHGYSHD